MDSQDTILCTKENKTVFGINVEFRNLLLVLISKIDFSDCEIICGFHNYGAIFNQTVKIFILLIHFYSKDPPMGVAINAVNLNLIEVIKIPFSDDTIFMEDEKSISLGPEGNVNNITVLLNNFIL